MFVAIFLISLSAFSFGCKAAGDHSRLQELNIPRLITTDCATTPLLSEKGKTWRVLIDAIQAKNCNDLEQQGHSLSLLQLDDKNIKNLEPLANFSQLQWLHLHGNQIRDLAPLRNLKKLKSLALDQNEVIDISPIGDLNDLQELNLSHNKIENIDTLTSLRELYILNLASNKINDLSSLAHLKNLIVLEIDSNPVLLNRNSKNCPIGDNVVNLLRDICR